MQVKTQGLIIREQTVGESDRLVTVLTRDAGVVRAFSRRAKNLKDSKSAATQLLCYSRLSIFKGREKYMIDDAEPIEVFFGIRRDIAALSLAQYFCELAGVLAPREEPAEEHLRLLLNALHFLTEGKRDLRLIKAVVELRLLTLSGYMPDLGSCSSCREADAPLWFLPRDGVLRCARCEKPGDALPLPPTLLAALRHIVHAPFEKCFAFQIPEEAVPSLAKTAEAFLLCQLGRSFQTLQFYHTMDG